MSDLISETELLEKFSAKNFRVLRKMLESQGVKFFNGPNGKTCTTIQAMNRALFGDQKDEDIDIYGT